MKGYFSGILFSIAYLVSTLATSAELDVRNGVLFGATGININGASYNVAFVSGSCSSLFSGCDEPSDFFFNDLDQSLHANQALLEQVLIDTSEGLFDSDPGTTNGCYDTDRCYIYTPIQATTNYTFTSRSVLNRETGIDVYTGVVGGLSRDADFSAPNYRERTFAVWSPVPLPGAFWLFGSAIIGIIGIIRNKNGF
ncbi:MAG: hypothetical protein AB2557_08005 [Candidatus Thiodiazotropha sp.]